MTVSKENRIVVLTTPAQITAKPGNERLVRAEQKKLVSATRPEAGCQQYDLHVDNKTPGLFVFCETGGASALWQAHMNAPHLAAHMQATDGAVDSFFLHDMTKIN